MLRLTKAGADALNALLKDRGQWDDHPPEKVVEREKVILKRRDVMLQLEAILLENGTPPDEVCAAYWAIEKHFGLPITTTCEIPPIGIEDHLADEKEEKRWEELLLPYATSQPLFQNRPCK